MRHALGGTTTQVIIQMLTLKHYRQSNDGDNMHITVKLTDNIDTQKFIFRCVKVDPRTYKQTHTPLWNKAVRGGGGGWVKEPYLGFYWQYFENSLST